MKFVTKYGVDGMPELQPILPDDTPAVKADKKKNNWTSRNKVKRSVNGFIMETYCELLGRRCTQEDMQRHLDEWPMGEELPEGFGPSGQIRTDGLVPAGLQQRLDTLHNAPLVPQQGELSGKQQTSNDDVPISGGIHDPDLFRRRELRKSLRTGDEFLERNLRRMILNVLNPRLTSDDYWKFAPDVIAIDPFVEQFFERYKSAVLADYGIFGPGRLPPEDGDIPPVSDLARGRELPAGGVKRRNHQAEFGRQLYSELPRIWESEPIQSWSRTDRLVFTHFYSWYMELNIPGPGPFDVWYPHPHRMLRLVNWRKWVGANAWGPIPGSVHGSWRMDGDEARDFLEQNFTDAVNAGVDVLIFSAWIRTGATIYPWLPLGGCQNWWECEGGDSLGLRWLTLAVQVLNRMKQARKPTPKLALGVETPQFNTRDFDEAGNPINARDRDPLHWAACTTGKYDNEPPYTAEWSQDEDPAPSDTHVYVGFPEAQRYFTYMIRAFFEKVPLEHIAFIEGRPVVNLWIPHWGLRASGDPGSGPAKEICRLFSQEFYGLHLWFMANWQWCHLRERPEDNEFVYQGLADPYDPESDTIRIGDVVTFGASGDARGPGLSGVQEEEKRTMTVYCLGPGNDGTTKTWAPWGTPGNPNVRCIAQREYGMLYYRNWVTVMKDGLAAEEPRLAVPPGGAQIYQPGMMEDDSQIDGKPTRVIIETWNELYEGTGICRSREYDDAYIDITGLFTRIWKTGTYPTDPGIILELVYWAFTGGGLMPTVTGLPPEFVPGHLQTWEGIGNAVSALREARRKHPPLVSVVGSSSVQVYPARQTVADGCWANANWFLPVTIFCTGTGKHEGDAYLWMKFYPGNPHIEGEDAWRVFTDPRFMIDEGVAQGGVVSWCRLIEVHQTEEESVPVWYGCIIDRLESDIRPNVLYQYDDRMRRPWTTKSHHPNVMSFPMPPFGVTYLALINIAIGDQYMNTDAVLQLGGSYVETRSQPGAYPTASSWVHLERSMHEFSLREPHVQTRPRRLYLAELGPKVEIMPLATGARAVQLIQEPTK